MRTKLLNSQASVCHTFFRYMLIAGVVLVGCMDDHQPLIETSAGETVRTTTPDTSKWTKRDSIFWGGNNRADWPETFGIGQAASKSTIEKLDIDIMPDGRGLPPGKGFTAIGEKVYLQKCAACHGASGREGPNNKLIGIAGDTSREKTIGNYWPYATTIFDYVRRAMPLNAPGSLTDAEVYHLTAFLLARNKIIDSTVVITEHNLAKIRMPAHELFIADDRRGGAEVR